MPRFVPNAVHSATHSVGKILEKIGKKENYLGVTRQGRDADASLKLLCQNDRDEFSKIYDLYERLAETNLD